MTWWLTWWTSAAGSPTCSTGAARPRPVTGSPGTRSATTRQRPGGSSRPRPAAALAADGALDHTVTVSYGEISARDYLWQLTVDLTVHAWDLARGIGADEQLEHELVRRIHAETEKDVETLAASGLFDPPVHVPTHADLQARMLGLFGRRA